MSKASRAYYDTLADTGSHEEADRAAAAVAAESTFPLYPTFDNNGKRIFVSVPA